MFGAGRFPWGSDRPSGGENTKPVPAYVHKRISSVISSTFFLPCSGMILQIQSFHVVMTTVELAVAFTSISGSFFALEPISSGLDASAV